MGKRSLRRKNKRKRTHLRKTRHTINKRRTRKMCVRCKCKVSNCSKINKKRKSSSRTRKLRGGGSLHLDKFIPGDIKNGWGNIVHSFQTLGSQMAGKAPPQPPSAVSQPYLANQKMSIPTRTNIAGSYASASTQVNDSLNSV